MFAGLYAKLLGAGLMLVALTTAVIWFASHERDIGADGVQAKWDAKKASQAVVAIAASEKARVTENAQATDFAGIATDYLQATTHEYPTLAVAIPAAVAAGHIQLRDACPTVAHSSGMPETTARSRVADAAATQALADRVQDSISAVQVGDAADNRERQLDAQVIGLQGVLAAERKEH